MSAVGEMLLMARGISVSQEKIRDIIGEPSDSKTLANALNQFDNSEDGLVWRGLFLGDIAEIERLSKQVKPGSLGVVLREAFSSTGHAVLLNGILRDGMMLIQDPFDQTSYKMTPTDFDDSWGLEVIVRWQPEK